MLAQEAGSGISWEPLITVLSVAGFVLWLVVIAKFFQLASDVREIKVALRRQPTGAAKG